MHEERAQTMTSADQSAPLKAQVLRFIRSNVDRPFEGIGVQTATIAQEFGLSHDEAVAVTEQLIHDLEINREEHVADPFDAKLFPAD
jgi:hypothetical protein